ncbi:hypothetical protein [uncultured Salinisphaera sp.]|uniref:hypothetical protein n=1 Tax=uncultured Salinisphaera sp. TaxID=359372 RepID=UPI0032B18881
MDISTNSAIRSMSRRLASVLAIASLGLLGVTSNAQAGIDIRAPFTHVGVDRHDGVNVAAPFTRVNVGGHRHHDDRRGYYNDRRYERRRYGHHRGWRDNRRAYRHHRDYGHYHERRHDRDRGFFGRW